ncbi:snoRNA-binding rRNA-processing protein utp10 [Umbelopsis sp. WA50703]
MSSLEQQLKQIGTADLRNVTENSRKYRSSFLFDAREAADQDLETIYSIGLNGIMELRILDSHFAAFESTLFSENMKSVDRVLQTKEENDKLDASIEAFLIHLSPYFLLKPAGKAIEWLIRRFRINEFNIDAVIACVLPYHETKAFVTMVSTLRIENDSPWVFLKPVKANRVIYERDLLVKKMRANKYILQFICESTAKAVTKQLSFKTLFSFYAATLIEYIKREDNIDENVLLTLMPHLLAGVRAKNIPEYQIATYMILSQMAVKMTMSEEALQVLLAEMTSNYTPKFFEHYLLTTVHLAQTQENFTAMPDKSYNALVVLQNYDEALLAICRKFSADAYMHPLLFNLTNSIFKHSNVVRLLASFLNSEYLTKETIISVCQKIMDQYLQYVEEEGSDKAGTFVDIVKLPLQALSQRHFEALDTALNNKLKLLTEQKSEANKQAADRLYQFSALAFNGTTHEVIKETNTTLYLSLQSPSANVRLLAVKKLISIIGEEDSSLAQSDDVVQSALMSCLIDDVHLLAYVFEEIPEFLIKSIEPTKILETLQAVLSKRHVLDKVARHIIKFFIGPLLDKAPELREAIIRIVLTYTFCSIRKLSHEHSIFHLVSGSSLDKDPLLAGFGKLKQKIQAGGDKEKDHQLKIATDLINLLANNLKKHNTAENVRFWLNMIGSNTIDEQVIAILTVNKCIAQLSNKSQYDMVIAFGTALQSNDSILTAHSQQHVKCEDLATGKDGLPPTRLLQDLCIPKKDGSAFRLELQVFSLINVTAHLSVPKEEIKWLDAEKSSLKKGEQVVAEYKEAVYLLFNILVTSTTAKLYDAALQNLFVLHLKAHSLEFLARAWSENDLVASPTVKARALQLAGMYIGAHSQDAIDYQLIVPSLLVAIGYPTFMVRKEAVKCLEEIHRVYNKMGAIGDDKFYNTAAAATPKKKVSANTYGYCFSEVSKLSHSDAAHLVDHIWYRRREMGEDSSYLATVLNEYIEACLAANKKTKMNRVLDFFLSCIDQYPTIFGQVSLLKNLANVQSSKKISNLIGLLERSLTSAITKESAELISELIRCFTPAFAPELGQAKTDKSLKLFCSLLENTYNMEIEGDEDAWEISTRRMALQQITLEFFRATSAKAREQIFKVMVNIATDSDQRDIKAVKTVIRDIDLTADLIEPFLQGITQKINEFCEQVDAPSKKSRKEAPTKENVESDLFELVTILEILEYKSIINGVQLAKPLFDILSALLNANLRDSPVSLEYVNQLILSALTKIVQSMEEQKIQPAASQLQVHLVVNCIRSTSNPQTHNSALLLMAAIASLDPESVLHNIMPVFTFMGANVLRQDDNYSFQVIQQTLKKILPALVASSRSRKQSEDSLVLEVKPILKVFVDALAHIPEHRQIHLFTTLVETLGEKEFLFAIISLVLERYLDRSNKGSSEAEYVKEFSLTVSQQFSARTQLHSLISLMKSLTALPNDKPQDVDMTATAVFNINEHTAKQLRQFKRACLQFAHELLGSRPFVLRVASDSHDDPEVEKELQQYYTQAAESVLQIIQYFSEYLSQYANSKNANAGIVKSWKETLKVAYKTLDKINLLLPIPAFIATITHLIKHKDVVIRRKAMELFKSRVEEMSSKELKIHRDALLEIVPGFAAVVELEKSTDDAGIVSKQTALDCITVITRHFGSSNPEVFANILPIVIGDSALKSDNSKIQIPSLVCLTFICNEIGPRAIPSLPKFMPTVLEMLNATIESETPDVLLQLSAITSLESIVHVMPHFVSPYVSRLLSMALHSNIQGYDETSDEKQQLAREKANSLLNEMAINISPRVLLSPVFAYLEQAIKSGKESVLALVELVDTAIKSMSRENVTAHYKQIFKFFLSVFDFRCQHRSEFSEESVSEVEQHSIQAFINLVMKLNETLFKPIFLKTLDWATIELAGEDSKTISPELESRTLFFYKLLDGLLEKLKSIFTPYFGYAIEHTIACLKSYTDGDRSPDTLWNYIMLAVRKSFLYDSDNLWNAEKFEKIFNPVLDQMLVTSAGDSEDYLARMITYLVPCVGQMAVTVSNDALWKPLNHGVLMKTREDDPEIRLAALRCLEELYTRLGEEWLLFLAESISFLAELMEDDDSRVEKLVHQVNAQIETYLGESLDKYFN